MKRRYPLESLRLAKQQQREVSAVATSSATERRRLAEEAASGVRAGRLRAAEELAARMAAEATRADGGSARAGDLVQAGHHQHEAELRLRAEEVVERRAEELAREARRAEDTARDDLSRARGAERAVDEHRARFVAAESEGAERRDEEQAEDAWNGARPRLGKSPAR